MTLWVYAITTNDAARRARVTGIAGEPIRFVNQGKLCAAVGEIAAIPGPSAPVLTRYDAVIRRLAARCPALLPARFGTTAADLDELAFILRSRGPSLGRALRAVRNRVQMTVRVVEKADAGRRAPEPAPEPSRGAVSFASGGDYLRSRAAIAARARDIPGFQAVRTATRRWVRDERVEKRLQVATVYHLVPRASAAAYRRAVERSVRAAGLQAVVSGPFPPYAFTGW